MRYRPVKLFFCYILITLVILFWGPVSYENINNLSIFIYMSFFFILFYCGYSLGAIQFKTVPRDFTKKKEARILCFVKFCIIIVVALQLTDLISTVTQEGFALKSPAQMYVEAYAGYERNTGRQYSILEIVNILAGTFKQVAVILGFYYFMEMKTKWKIFVILLIFIIALNTFIFKGKQKQLGDIVILMLGVSTIKFSASFKKKIPRKYVLMVAILFVGVLFAFANNQTSRLESANVDLSNYDLKSQASISMNEHHPIYMIFGDDLGFGMSLVANYVTNGYYGLSQTLELPFEWTYGLGNSYAIAVFADRFLGLPFYFDTKTYPFRAERITGWPAYVKWHTIFPWLASDFTFVGALLLFSIIAFIYAICWIESYKYGNPFSIALFCTLNIMLIYVPANNQLMMNPESVMMLFSLFVAWLLRHNSYNFKMQ